MFDHPFCFLATVAQWVFLYWAWASINLLLVIRASVPRMELDAAFEQKNEIAKAVEEELEKVIWFLP